MSDTLEKHIDLPIRKAVVGMNLLGFTTYMSCCWFTYDNEEVPKTHLKKAYIYLDKDQIYNNTRLAAMLCKIQINSNWRITNIGKFLDFYADTWTPGHPWEKKDAVHNYEIYLDAIYLLNKSIGLFESEMIFDTEIRDGNEFYIQTVSPYWKYKPTSPWKVTYQTYHQLK